MAEVALRGARVASYQVIGSGRPALMFAGGPGFAASYMTGDAELLSDTLQSYLIDPHGSGTSTPPADSANGPLLLSSLGLATRTNVSGFMTNP